jgi:uncharacterized protein (TIGR02099 family)
VFFAAALRGLKRSSVWTWRALAWSVVAAALASAFFVLGLRYWFLPNIEAYREDIAQAVSRAANLRITIGSISADWDGIRPHLKLGDVTVYDEAGRRALDLSHVESTLSWRSLATRTLHFHALDIYRPHLEVRRDAQGVYSVAGIRLKTEDRTRGGFTEWLLQQRDVEVHDAAVVWTDELRGAPALTLSGVALQLVNRGDRHRFGMRAVPPAALASPLDVRGDVRGESLQVLSEWNGALFLQLDHVDLAAWSPWIDIPIEVTRGAGAVRSWLTFSHDALSEIVADVRLSALRTRLRKDLPQLDLDHVSGRLAWKELRDGFELSAAKLALSGAATKLDPADFRVRLTTDRSGVDHGEANADALDLAPLVMLADRLPLAEGFRAQLVAHDPRGRLNDVAVKWTGEWAQPQSYSVRGAFAGLAFNRRDRIPGVSGLTGAIDGTEKGGTLALVSHETALDMPAVFKAPLTFDTLAGQVAWSRTRERLDVKVNNVAFVNADAAGTLSGTYNTVPQGKGEVDLTGMLTRADARGVARYIPLTITRIRPWLERAFLAGRSNDVRFHMKGRLEDFPYPQDKRGVFHVTAKVTGGILDYAERWPRIDNIEGEFEFRGARMTIAARQGTVNGVKLSKVYAEIPDLKAIPEMLTVSGEAEGATSEFLSFIAKSPVSEMIERFTDGMQAQGPGRLALKLTLPLGDLQSTQLAGSFQFFNNNITIERDLPALEQASGRIDFTESSVRTPGLNGTFLGGPVTISGESQRDSTLRATLTGRASADNVRKAGGPAWMQHLKGAADWRGTLTLRKKVPHLVIESNLKGIASSLPAPFSKTAGESVALRIERRSTGAQTDRVSVAYGDIVKAELARRSDGKEARVERGVVRFGPGEIGELERPGVWVRGTVNRLDFDDWLAFNRGRESAGGFAFAGADVKFGELDFFGRHFSNLGLAMTPQAGAMHLVLTGRDIEGTATWRGEGKGRLSARLKKLVLPAAEVKPAPPGGGVPASAQPEKSPELPAVDMVVEQFHSGVKQLGRLELTAVPQDRGWKIEKLKLANADAVLTADGLWQGWLTEPRTQMNVRMDVTDIGKTLTRWGYPAGVRRGTAKIEGQLSWAGNPQDFDYPTLAGKLVVDAANGQFVKLDPGIAKLLGILSLQALPRRITLDFRDVFSEGFHFDTISGTLQVERGIMHTENFRIQGASARVVMAGDVDLARETQKLRVRVTPHLSESVSIAGALIGGPVAGAAMFLAQKILRDPIENFVSFEYNVAGSWSEPLVGKVERTPPAVAESSSP